MKRVMITIAALMFLGEMTVLEAQPLLYQPGRDYEVIASPVRTADPARIEVVEYFWYGCPGCYQFDPLLAAWDAARPDDVTLLRLPAIWDEWRELHARAYYIAEHLNKLDTLHDGLFHAMHAEGNRLPDRAALGALFMRHGVDKSQFDKAYDSFSVTRGIRQAQSQAVQYGVRSTPSLVVNGKYVVSLRADTLQIVDFLIARERDSMSLE